MNNPTPLIIPEKSPGDNYLAAESNILNNFLTYEVGNYSQRMLGSYFPDDNEALVAANGMMYDFLTAMNLAPPGWRLPDPVTDWQNAFNVSGTFYDDMLFTTPNYRLEAFNYIDFIGQLAFWASGENRVSINVTTKSFSGAGDPWGLNNPLGYALPIRFVKDDDGSADTLTQATFYGQQYDILKLGDGKIWMLENLRYNGKGIGNLLGRKLGVNNLEQELSSSVFSTLSSKGISDLPRVLVSDFVEFSSSQIANMNTTPLQLPVGNSQPGTALLLGFGVFRGSGWTPYTSNLSLEIGYGGFYFPIPDTFLDLASPINIFFNTPIAAPGGTKFGGFLLMRTAGGNPTGGSGPMNIKTICIPN